MRSGLRVHTIPVGGNSQTAADRWQLDPSHHLEP